MAADLLLAGVDTVYEICTFHIKIVYKDRRFNLPLNFWIQSDFYIYSNYCH